MSHFVLVVALPSINGWEEELAERMAPYDENVSVEPRPDYEDGAAADFWWYKSLQRDATAVANQDHSIIRPHNPDMIGWNSSESRDTPEQQWADAVRDATVFHQLPTPVTWEALVAAHNDYYCEGNPHSDGSPMFYEAETDRAYTLTTYNPDSKWDYYRVGGRWARYFPLGDTTDPRDNRLIRTDLSWEWRDASPEDRPAADQVEGGPKGLLDLGKLRDRKEAEAAKAYDEFWEFAKDYPKAKGWKELVDETDNISDVAERRAAIDRAREVYRAQPLVEATNQHTEYRRFWGCPLDEYSGDRDEHLATARRNAVPGYSLLTLERQWASAGEMGWFGMGSDTTDSTREYKEFANEYLDSLSDETVLVSVDLHI